MSSKRLFSWSKRQPTQEQPYYRTGGLLPIDQLDVDASGSESSNTLENKEPPKSKRQRPPNLTIVPPDSDQFVQHPQLSPRNAALASSSSNLFAIFNDMLRSPATGASASPQSGSIHKPLPTRPRSLSLPSSPGPVELPGSILQDNQGYPDSPTVAQVATSRPISYLTSRNFSSPESHVHIIDDSHCLPELDLRSLNHAKSVPSLVSQYSTMRPAQNNRKSSGSTALAIPSPISMQHRQSMNDMAQRGTVKPSQPSAAVKETKPRPSAVSERSSYRNDSSASHPSTSAAARSKQIGDLKATVTTHEQAISKLKAQLASLQASHESHAAAVAETHATEVASVRNRASQLEEQFAEHPNLHRAPSNNLLFVFDTPELSHTPTPENQSYAAGTAASSARASQAIKQRLSLRSSEMESLKRKLTTTKRPEPCVTTRNLLPELNQYKQNNAALQTQIGSLMTKLNQSRRNEKELKASLEDADKKCREWEGKASAAEKLAQNMDALKNSIDHLEYRLEVANLERLDAQEELYNLRMHRSPFDPKDTCDQSIKQKEASPTLEPNVQTRSSTVLSSEYLVGNIDEPTTLAGFVAHIDRLQEQLRQKDAFISELQDDTEYLRRRHDELEQERDGANLELEIQANLVGKTQEMDRHVEQLRSAIIDRESIIEEKEKSVCDMEKQLEQHKLLLMAETRKHAAMLRHDVIKQEPLPELRDLATQRDIDRWIHQLNQHLRSSKPVNAIRKPMNRIEAQVQDLQDEIEFYVREILYYKLDIRGYKSDIKQLKKNVGEFSRQNRPLTPPRRSPEDALKATKDYFSQPLGQRAPMTPQSMSSTWVPQTADDADEGSPKSSPRFARQSLERSKRTSPSHEKFGGLLASFPLNFPIEPQGRGMRRSMSESRIVFNATPRSPDITPAEIPAVMNGKITHTRGRSVSDMGSSRRQGAPERPVKPQYGLSELPEDLPSATQPAALLQADEPIQARTIDRFSVDTEITDIVAAYSAPPPVTRSRRSRPLPPLPTLITSVNSQSSSTRPSVIMPYKQLKQPSLIEHQPDLSADSVIPFFKAMGAPHNPALFVAAKNMPVYKRTPIMSACSTSRTGVGGTMASSPPPAPPSNHAENFQLFPRPSTANSGHTRTASLPVKQENMPPNPPRIPVHTRNASTNSIRTAIRLPKRDKDVEGHRIQKGSIGMPRPLESPFYIDQVVAGTPALKDKSLERKADGLGIGEAI